jgi:putative DNA primase/helicase
MRHERTTEAARGRWRGILASLGMPESYLSGKHGPCPLCAEGKDRFRFDDREGKGSWICSRCGAGDGIGLAMRFTGLGFAEAASRVDDIIRNVKPDSFRPKREMTDGERLSALRALWAEPV